ncbi:HEPN domain-containing protein [Candidatus Thalassolituus haligoni]|uniref:ApeA N-terminal domain 1-containing protein n=1 Tax=Candidatus Thalassolituus haligoni TaxID=3100113 RepID=UPI0035155FAA
MSFDLEALKLADTYHFEGAVNDGSNDFAAKLYLSPEKITITIMGEKNDERNCDFGWGDIETLLFTDMNKTFILHDLCFCRGGSRVISQYPKYIGFFESVFEVGYLIFAPSGLYENDLVQSICIHSNKISEWVGNTNKQEEIIRAYNNNERLFDDHNKLDEFYIPLEETGILGVSYNLSMHHSSPDFSAGIIFPPSLIITFCVGHTSKEVMNDFFKLYALLAFFIGSDFIIEQIDLNMNSSHFGNKGTLYYPSKMYHPKYEQDYSTFPLGKDIRFDSLGLPPLPLTAFSKYYALPVIQSGYFLKYLKYKRLENSEERFLGYFRILESLCFNKKSYLNEELLEKLSNRIKPYLIKVFGDKKSVTSFLKGLPRYNNSKYNTQKCILDFYVKIPQQTSGRWKLYKRDISGICKLRNDITHANDYSINASELVEKEKFIEVLLVFSLFEKLDITLPITSEIIDRLSGYSSLIRYEA